MPRSKRYDEGREWELAPHLGPSFARCAVLESLRLGGVSVDLLVVTGNGDVALGECKRGSRLGKVRNAFSQLVGYVREIRRLRPGWLRRQLDISYDRFDFPGFSQVLKELGVRSEKQRRRWFRRVEHRCSDGEIYLFAAVGRAGERAVDIWVIEKSGEVRA